MHTLLKGLEKIAVSADIPMLVCGDFNSVPGRFVFCVVLQLHFLTNTIRLCQRSVQLIILVIELCCSAPHHLLARGKVEPTHPDLAVDPLNLCQPHSKLSHQLPLVSLLSTLSMYVNQSVHFATLRFWSRSIKWRLVLKLSSRLYI